MAQKPQFGQTTKLQVTKIDQITQLCSWQQFLFRVFFGTPSILGDVIW